jgi:hypothetical protein
MKMEHITDKKLLEKREKLVLISVMIFTFFTAYYKYVPIREGMMCRTKCFYGELIRIKKRGDVCRGGVLVDTE